MATQSKPYGEQQGVTAPTAATTTVSAVDAAVGASIIAGGIGSTVLGVAIVLAEANADFKTFLAWNSGVGPLSGKTGLAVIAFFLSWVVLHFAFKNRPVKLMTSFIIGMVLIAAGLLMTYPPIFLFLAGK